MTSRRRITALAAAAGVLFPLIPLSVASAARRRLLRPTTTGWSPAPPCSPPARSTRRSPQRPRPRACPRTCSRRCPTWSRAGTSTPARSARTAVTACSTSGPATGSATRTVTGLPLSAINDKDGPGARGHARARLRGGAHRPRRGRLEVRVAGQRVRWRGAARVVPGPGDARRRGHAEPAGTTSDSLGAWEDAVARMSDIEGFATRVYTTFARAPGRPPRRTAR